MALRLEQFSYSLIGAVCLMGLGRMAAADVPAQRTVTPAEVVRQAELARDTALQNNDPATLTQALQAVRAVLERDAANPDANLLAGEILVDAVRVQPSLADYDAALKHFKVVLDFEPRNFRANLGTGRIWNANRSWRQAIAYLEKAEQVAPDTKRSVEVKRELALALAGAGNMTSAVEKATEAAQGDPTGLDGLLTLVEIRMRAAERDPARHLGPALSDAENYLQKVKEAVQATPESLALLQRLDRAFELLLAVLRAYHNNLYERDIRNQPTDQLQKGREAEAAAALDRIVRLMRERALLHVTIVDHEAILAAEKAVEYDPRNISYLENLAALYDRTHQREKAIEVCQRILEVDPQHAGARAYLEAAGAPAASQPAAESQPATTAPAAPASP